MIRRSRALRIESSRPLWTFTTYQFFLGASGTETGTEGVVEQVTGTELNKILYGDLVEAYDTKLFGIASTRSDAGKQKQTRLAELNVKSRHEKLTATESAEQQMLRAAMPTAAVMTTVEP